MRMNREFVCGICGLRFLYASQRYAHIDEKHKRVLIGTVNAQFRDDKDLMDVAGKAEEMEVKPLDLSMPRRRETDVIPRLVKGDQVEDRPLVRLCLLSNIHLQNRLKLTNVPVHLFQDLSIKKAT